MSGKELLGMLELMALAAAAAFPGSAAALAAAAMVQKLIESLGKLMDGEVTEADLRLPSYEETLAEVRAKQAGN